MLDRFKEAQEEQFLIALNEVKSGEKKTHWIWYIFPQLKGLGISSTSQYYGLNGLEEAKEYYNDDYLRNNLITICNALLNVQNKPIQAIFKEDSIKVHSCITLFYIASNNDLFMEILNKYFDGQYDQRTLDLLD